jgi:hypothetical protein
MPLKLLIHLSKKIPGPTDYSSIQASCSIEGDLDPSQDLVAASARLYAQAEAAVDRQLGLSAPATTAATAAARGPQPHSPSLATSSASQPYIRPARRPPTSVTPAQLRLIDQLLRDSRTDPAAVLQHFGVTALEQLACKDASALIDDLKARAAGRAP